MKKHIFIYILSLILLILVILLGLSENKLSKEVARLNTEISSYKYAITQANDNIEEANVLDITGVPFIYVNKQEIMGEVGLDDLKRMIELELAK